MYFFLHKGLALMLHRYIVESTEKNWLCSRWYSGNINIKGSIPRGKHEPMNV